MEKYSVKVTRISVNGNDERIWYRLMLDKAIPAYMQDADRNIVLGESSHIDFTPNALIAQCINCVPELAAVHTNLAERSLREAGVRSGLGAAQLTLFLTGAQLTVERTQFKAGEEYTDSNGETNTHEYDGFRTDIKEVELATSGARQLDRAMDRLIG